MLTDLEHNIERPSSSAHRRQQLLHRLLPSSSLDQSSIQSSSTTITLTGRWNQVWLEWTQSEAIFLDELDETKVRQPRKTIPLSPVEVPIGNSKQSTIAIFGASKSSMALSDPQRIGAINHRCPWCSSGHENGVQ
jgi:hypothetical protein